MGHITEQDARRTAELDAALAVTDCDDVTKKPKIERSHRARAEGHPGHQALLGHERSAKEQWFAIIKLQQR